MRKALLAIAGFCAACATAQQTNNFVYQVFVRSFADTPADTAPADAKGEIGDLRGLRERLDYINDGRPGKGKDLEAGILWLMPVFPSATYHGYDIDDYQAINPEYGSIDDMDALIAAAHKRGVRIVLDIAFNHTSTRHEWFRRAVAEPASPFRNFYHMEEEDGSPLPRKWHVAQGVRYLGLFSSSMPDLNLDEPRVRQQVKSIAKFWLDRGIDGFRLDAAKHVFDAEMGDLTDSEIRKNNDWWREFSDYVYSVKPGAVLVGEVLGDTETLRRHAYGLDALLDAPFMHGARSHIVSPQPGFLQRWIDATKSYREVNRQAPGTRSFDTWAFLASHDENPRLASFLQEKAGSRVPEAYRLAMFLLFTAAKYPLLYNGDELMQPGWKWRGNPPDAADEPGDGSRIYDETLREPFPWFKSSTNSPQTGWFPPRFDKPNDGISVEEQKARGSMLDLVRSLGRLRVQNPAFANADIGPVLTDSHDWLVFAKDRYLVLINTTGQANTYRFHDDWHPEWRGAKVTFATGASKGRIRDEASVPAYGLAVLQQTGEGQ